MTPVGYVFDPKRVSVSCLAYIRGMEKAHEEWQRRRAEIHDWKYNKATGMAEER